MTQPTAPAALTSIRVAGTSDGLDVMLMGPGPFPIVAWHIPRAILDQVLDDDAAAVVQCDPRTGAISLHYPPLTKPDYGKDRRPDPPPFEG
jgi:hypothetical protein